jgi:phosphatidate cytidylyltransferase
VLRTRVITGLIIAPLAVAAIYLLPLGWFALFFWVVAAVATYEWAGLIGLQGVPGRTAYVGLFGLLAALVWWAPQGWFGVGLWVGAAMWLAATVIVMSYPRGSAPMAKLWVAGGIGLIIMLAAWIALIVIRAEPGANGANWLLWLLMLVWGADIGGYFVGRQFGRRKLALAVSPGKTWEGAIGGLILSLIVCGVSLLLLGYSAWWLATIAGLVVVSVVGDLFESVLKRLHGVKDSGNLLPGHGGILDRIDSLLAVLPVFALIITR